MGSKRVAAFAQILSKGGAAQVEEGRESCARSPGQWFGGRGKDTCQLLCVLPAAAHKALYEP